MKKLRKDQDGLKSVYVQGLGSVHLDVERTLAGDQREMVFCITNLVAECADVRKALSVICANDQGRLNDCLRCVGIVRDDLDQFIWFTTSDVTDSGLTITYRGINPFEIEEIEDVEEDWAEPTPTVADVTAEAAARWANSFGQRLERAIWRLIASRTH
jgi:hypothetical protein